MPYHLALLGHEDIVSISGCAEDSIGRDTTLERRAGFRDGMRVAGLAERPDQNLAEPWRSTEAGGPRSGCSSERPPVRHGARVDGAEMETTYGRLWDGLLLRDLRPPL